LVGFFPVISALPPQWLLVASQVCLAPVCRSFAFSLQGR
jgi:hypothetical protein